MPALQNLRSFATRGHTVRELCLVDLKVGFSRVPFLHSPSAVTNHPHLLPCANNHPSVRQPSPQKNLKRQVFQAIGLDSVCEGGSDEYCQKHSGSSYVSLSRVRVRLEVAGGRREGGRMGSVGGCWSGQGEERKRAAERRSEGVASRCERQTHRCTRKP